MASAASSGESLRGAGWRSSRCRSQHPRPARADQRGRRVGRRAALDQDAGDFSAIHADVVGPFDAGSPAGPGGDDFGGRDGAQCRQPGQPRCRRQSRQASGAGGGKSRTDIKIDDTRRGRPGPALAASAGGLFLGQDHQAIVGPGVSSPSREVIRAGDAVPDHDTPPEPARCQLVFDLIGTEPLGGPHVGRTSVGVLLDPEAKRDQGRQIASDLLEVRTQLAERHVITRDRAEPVEKSNIQARFSV